MAATTSLIALSQFAHVPVGKPAPTFPEHASACLAPPCAGARPHFFEIVEGAHFRAEYVDDDIAGVDQHPITMGQALDARIRYACLFQAFQDAIRDGAHVSVRPAAGYDH